MAMPTTVNAAMTTAKAEYAAGKMEHGSAKLRLERAQLQLEQAKNEFSSFHASDQANIASLDTMTEVRIFVATWDLVE